MSASSLFRLVLLGMIWGASFLFQRITVPAVGAPFTAAVRLALAAVMLVVLLRLLGRSLNLRAQWRDWLVLGTINSAVPFLCFAFAAKYLPAGYLAVINATVPLLTVLFVWGLLHQRPSATKLLGVIVGLAGVAVLARYGSVGLDAATLGAFALALTAASLYAYSALYIRRRHAGSDPLVLAGASQLGAALVLAPLGAWAMPTVMPAPIVIVSLLVLGLLCTGLAYALYFRLLADIGSEKAVSNTFLVPVFAQIWGALFLQEHLTVAGAVGFGLVFVAIALVLELVPWRRRGIAAAR